MNTVELVLLHVGFAMCVANTIFNLYVWIGIKAVAAMSRSTEEEESI